MRNAPSVIRVSSAAASDVPASDRAIAARYSHHATVASNVAAKEDPVDVSRHLGDRLGGHDPLAIERASLEEHIENMTGGTCKQLQEKDHRTGHIGHTRSGDVEAHPLRQQ